MTKTDDWLLAVSYNPTLDVSDFQYILKLDINNTLFLSYDDYLKWDRIKTEDAFKDNNGNFSEEKLQKLYKKAASLWGRFSSETLSDNYTYDMWDRTAPPLAKKRNPGFYMTRVLNPDDYTIGINGFNNVTPSKKSWRELAQQNKIYDSKEQKFTDKSVNDISLFESPLEYFKSLFHDPLIYAMYDEDTEEFDPYVGLVVKHYKGEKKLDKFGNYYTETLNGRSLIGKEIVSAMDYVTAEGTKINNYDFFDSDDRKKSIGGIITQNLVSIAPFFIPYVNTVYTGMVIAKEMATTLPMLYGIIMGFTGSEDVESPLLNTIAAYGERVRTSTSDYAKENTLSFENIANLASMVVGQWNQCRMIGGGLAVLGGKSKKAIAVANAQAFEKYNTKASLLLKDAYNGKIGYSLYAAYIGTDSMSGFQRLLTSGKWAETPLGKAALLEYLVPAQQILQKYNKIGLTLSIAYMSIICNTIVYDTVVQHGATPFEAACITLGSIAGMFSVDKFLGLGELFFDPDETRLALKAATKSAAEALMKKADLAPAKTITLKGIIGLMLKGALTGRRVAEDFVLGAREHTLGFVGKTVGVALENVAELVAADVSQLFGEIAGRLGYFSLKDYGAWDNVFDRYLLNAIGGAFGGSMFYVLMAFNARGNATNKLQKDLLYLLSTGRVTVDLINSLIDAAAKKGLLGSNELSNETTLDEDGNTVYLSADNGRESQAQYWSRFLKDAVSALNQTVVGNRLNYTEDLLFDKMVLGEYKRLTLADLFAVDADKFKATSYITKFYDDYFGIVSDIATKEAQINALMAETPDPAKRNNTDYQKKLNDLEKEKQLLIDRKNYLFGEGSLGYVEKTLFAMDTKLNFGIVPLTRYQVARLLFYKPLNELTLSELNTLEEVYTKYSLNIPRSLNEVYNLFKDMGKKINPNIQEMQNLNLKQQIQATELLVNSYHTKLITYDTKLEDESDEEYAQRRTKKESETNEQFLLRQQERTRKIQKLIDLEFSNFIDSVLKLPLTSNIRRLLEANIRVRKKDIIEYNINKINFSILENEVADKIREQLRAVDFTNEDEVNSVRNKIIQQYYVPIVEKENETLKELQEAALNNEGVEEGLENYIKNFDPREFTYKDLYDTAISKIMARKNYEKKEQVTNKDIIEEEYNIFEQIIPDWNREKNPTPPSVKEVELVRRAFEAFFTNDSKAIDKYKNMSPYISEYDYNLMCKQIADDLFLINTDKSFLDAIKDIVSNPSYTNLIKVENKKYTDNPVIPLLKIIASIRNGNTNIDTLLTEIYTEFNNVQTITDFRIPEEQAKELLSVLNDMKIAKAYIHAASFSDNFQRPIGHNKAINEFVKAHPEIFKKIEQLPEISEDLGNYLIHELEIFEQEANEWMKISMDNTLNRLNRFTEGEEKLNTTLVKFFKTNREAFKISDTVDLLDGFESFNDIIDKNGLLAVAVISLLLYNNFTKALNNGLTEIEILNALFNSKEDGGKGIINLQECVSQLQAKYDQNLSIGNITNYDKWLFIINSFAMTDYAFIERMRAFLEKNTDICSLPLQERAAKIALCHRGGREVINIAMEYILDKTSLKDKLPMLRNAVIVAGIGGAGKSFIISRLSIETGKKIWLSGPGKSQIDNLSNNIKTGEKKSIHDLIVSAVGSEAAKEIEGGFKKGDDGTTIELNENGQKYFTKSSYNNDNLVTITLKDDVKINTIKNAPDYIVIDEATWLNTHEILLLDAFCNKNNIELILIADLNLNGKQLFDLSSNIDNTSIFAWRTPELYLSLRDNMSIQKDGNLNGILSMLYTLRTPRSVEELNSVATREITNVLNKFKFKYYLNNNQFFGELVTDTLDDNILKSLNGTVCYIGDKNSAIEKVLQKAGIAHDVHTVETIQGREYDYVIVDKDWNYNLDGYKKGYELNELLKDVYTMISRSRQGTIIINNNFSKFFTSIKDTTTGTNNDIKDAILSYRKDHIANLNLVLLKIKELFPDATFEERLIKQKKSEPEKTPTTPNGKKPVKKPFTPAEEDSPRPAVDLSDLLDKIELATVVATVHLNNPIRAYGNVHIGGITIAEHGGTWINDTSSRRDLGIFVNPGETISSLEDKRNVTFEILKLKSLFHFGLTNEKYTSPKSELIREKFSFEAIENAKYFVRIETPNNTNTLIGHTTLDNKLRAILNGKMATVIAKIVGKDGNTYEVSLGALSNPDTWISNLPNIHESLKNTIDKLGKKVELIEDKMKKGKITNEDTEAKNRLKALISTIQKYNENVDTLANEYKTVLTNTIKSVKEDSYEYEIDAPEFIGLTDLVDTPKKMVFRLEHLSDFDDSTVYADLNEYGVISDPYIVRKSPWDISEKMQGRAVIFVSSDPYIEADELMQLYRRLKEDSSIVPRVRMVSLSNLGVSFKSLYKRYDNDKYRSEYKKEDGKDYNRYIPFENLINGIRMYNTFWNFRAAITRFVEEVKAFKNGEITTDNALTKARIAYQSTLDEITRTNPISENELLRILKTDSDIYARYNRERKEGESFINEDIYRSKVRTDTNIDEKTKAALAYVWEFNDYLSRSGVREFRLGYSLQYGFYNRSLTHLESDIYKGVDNPIGVYINPDLAVDYKNVIDALFVNIIDKIIPPANTDIRYFMSDYDKYNLSTKGRDISWFLDALANSALDIPVYDSNGNLLEGKNIVVKGNAYNAFSALPGMLISTARHLYFSRLRDYMENILKSSRKGRIKYDPNRVHLKGKEESSEKSEILYLDWFPLLDALSNPLKGVDPDNTLTLNLTGDLRSNVVLNESVNARNISFKDGMLPPGIVKASEEIDYGFYDMRLENLFDLIFHGHIVPAKYEDNISKNTGVLIATDAYYKYGIFVDPVKVININDTSDSSGGTYFEQLLSGALFGTDKIAGFPLMLVNINPKTDVVTTETAAGESKLTTVPEKAKAELFDFVDKLNLLYDLNIDGEALTSYNINNVLDFVYFLNNAFISQLSEQIQENTNIVDTAYSIEVDSDSSPKVKSVRDKIKELTGLEDFNIFKQALDTNGHLILTLNSADGPEVEVYKSDNMIVIKSRKKLVAEVLEPITYVGDFITIMLKNTSAAVDNLLIFPTLMEQGISEDEVKNMKSEIKDLINNKIKNTITDSLGSDLDANTDIDSIPTIISTILNEISQIIISFNEFDEAIASNIANSINNSIEEYKVNGNCH